MAGGAVPRTVASVTFSRSEEAPMLHLTAPRAAVAALATIAVAAPAASARPADAARPATPVHGPATRTIQVSTSRFDWADAGLGAAAMLTLLGVGGGAVVVARRRQPSVS